MFRCIFAPLRVKHSWPSTYGAPRLREIFWTCRGGSRPEPPEKFQPLLKLYFESEMMEQPCFIKCPAAKHLWSEARGASPFIQFSTFSQHPQFFIRSALRRHREPLMSDFFVSYIITFNGTKISRSLQASLDGISRKILGTEKSWKIISSNLQEGFRPGAPG